MDDELKSRLTSYLDHIESAVESTADFSAEQAPLLVQEFLHWELVRNVSWASCWGLTTLVLLLLTVAFWFRSRKAEKGSEEKIVWLMCAGGILAFLWVPASVCVDFSMNAVKVSVAPRVVVLEKVADLID